MKANPYDHRAWLVRGIKSTREGNLTEAEKSLDEAIKLCPFGLEAWLQLAALKAKQNKPADAKAVLLKARRVCDDEADRQIDEILNRLGP
jgi:cytochrome c-type biogenesis protein CcmH/NrfG